MFADPPLTAREPAPAKLGLDDYLADQLFHPQWRAFARAIASELFSNFDPEEAAGFLRQIGRRMAQDLRLERLETLPELEAVINEALRHIGWGVAEISVAGHEIVIVHRAFPALRQDDPEAANWRQAYEALLEGLYAAWFEGQGASPEMRTRAEAASEAHSIQLRIGY